MKEPSQLQVLSLPQFPPLCPPFSEDSVSVKVCLPSTVRSTSVTQFLRSHRKGLRSPLLLWLYKRGCALLELQRSHIHSGNQQRTQWPILLLRKPSLRRRDQSHSLWPAPVLKAESRQCHPLDPQLKILLSHTFLVPINRIFNYVCMWRPAGILHVSAVPTEAERGHHRLQL